MLYQFLAVSGLAFWLIVAAIAFIDMMLLSTEDGNDAWAIFITVIALIATALFTNAFQGARVGYIVAGVLVYFTIGVLWSFKKWYSFVVSQLNALRNRYNDGRYVNKAVKGNETFESYAKDHQPLAAANKQRIIGWMALWPFSLSWWVLTWPRYAFVWAYNRLSTIFDRISAKIWASAS